MRKAEKLKKKANPRKKKKSVLKRKRTAKKTASRRKSAANKKLRRKAGRTFKKAAKQSSAKRPLLGDPVGRVTHYFPHVQAAVVKIEKGALSIGDTIHFKGHTTDFKEALNSIQLDHAPIQTAGKGSEVGVGVSQRVREGDLVFKIKTP